MTKLFIPPLKTKLRLLAPWRIVLADCMDRYGNNKATAAAWRVHYGEELYDWVRANAMTEFTLEAGTVIEFKRYHLSSQARMDAVKLTIFASPRRDLMPKNRGGASTQVEFEVPVRVLNGIEYEETDL